jgi:signal peptidase II
VENGVAETPDPAGARRAPANWMRRVLVAVAAIVVLDQLTKSWVVARYSQSPLSIVGDTVEFHVTRNAGSAFGRFQGMTPILAIGAIVVSVFLVRTVRRASDAWTVAALALVLGGALGNFVDRVVRAPGCMRGHVVDFVKVGSFPVFNLADSCITIGAILLVLRSLFPPTEPDAADVPAAGTGDD